MVKSDPHAERRFWSRLWHRLVPLLLPHTLLGRLSIVMVAGVMLTQLLGNVIWAAQRRAEAEIDVVTSAQHVAHSAASAVRFFLSLPANYRPLIIQQFREMGGTRFLVNLNHAPIEISGMVSHGLADSALTQVRSTLLDDVPNLSTLHVALAWPEQLVVGDDGTRIGDLPASWVQHIVLSKPAPILLIQAEMEPGHWLYLASLMPNPYFLDSGNPWPLDRLLLQLLSLAAVLALSFLVVRWTTRPLAALSEAAQAFGNGEHMPALPETGSREFVTTARAFGAMRERIARYIDERERLFISISHDLRTPIMRLKLRAEMLDDDSLRNEFHDDLDDLDMMVKGALQCVKDGDIHENPTEIRLDALLGRMVDGARLAGHQVAYAPSGLSVTAKPLALKRAIGNLLDNGLFYGKRVDIALREHRGNIEIALRDHGPGVPQEAFATLFDPYLRLEHGRRQNSGGLGLGLGIARAIVQAHGGELVLENDPGGGLRATIILPGQVADGLEPT